MKATQYILICLLFCTIRTTAQELHFSQYFNTPLLVNPANTGFNPDCDYRVGVNYRNQWANVLANPYKTSSVWGDAQLFTNKFVYGWVGIGGTLYQDQAGSANLTGTKGYLSLAYHQMLGDAGLLSLGVSAGAVNKKIDQTKLVFDDQWNEKIHFFDAYTPGINGETFANTNNTYLDMTIGLNYAWFISETAYLNLGFSAMHINRPTESFFTPTPNTDQRVPVRYTYFINGSYKILDLWILNPNIYISKSAHSTEAVLGLNANRDLSGDGAKQLILGLYYRYNDAFIPMVGYQLNNYKLTVSYDVTSSGLSSFNGLQGGYEASIVKSDVFGEHKGIKCPTVKF